MAKFRDAFRFRYFVAGLGIAALAALALSAVSGLPFWACFAMAMVAMLVNGWFAIWEDNQPGGFNNPGSDEPSTPTQPKTTHAKD